MPDLHLNLKGEYFDEIVAGTKPFEYRLKNNYWTKRLVGRRYKYVLFKRGYPEIYCQPDRPGEIQTEISILNSSSNFTCLN